MKVTFYYVRHGETRFNQKSRMQGVSDSPLTPLGIEQASKARDALKDIYFDHIYTSPSGRCQQTASILLEGRNIQPIIENNLHEFDFGTFEGSRFPSHPEEIRHCFECKDFTSVRGENVERVQDRIDTFFSEILSNCKDGDHVLLVSHGFLEEILIGYLLKEDFNTYADQREAQGKQRIPNGGIMTFTYEDDMYKAIQLPIEPESYVQHIEEKTIHFYYVNHGQTRFNEANRMQGVSDSPLTQRGIQESINCANALKDVSIQAIYSSPLMRCVDLANLIAHDRNLPVIITESLKEIDYGEFEGVVRDSWLREIKEHREKHDDYSDVGGEGQIEFEERVKHIMHKIISSSKDYDTVVLVGHSEYYKRMLEILFGFNGEEEMMAQRTQGLQPHPYGGTFHFTYTNGTYTIVSMMAK